MKASLLALCDVVRAQAMHAVYLASAQAAARQQAAQ